ncbi:hypothetical protein CTheo_4884 [Ceratobasidium theobromae]|uniref:Ras-GEF domain-containing protein n=1 Tax=Ceratobasidium theobromae TaxID=1582974 RepID=A0A5N5QJP1_9AGAM|nr:hypothetical protein CTheo_4884 [Ceratobasidium theobromae]
MGTDPTFLNKDRPDRSEQPGLELDELPTATQTEFIRQRADTFSQLQTTLSGTISDKKANNTAHLGIILSITHPDFEPTNDDFTSTLFYLQLFVDQETIWNCLTLRIIAIWVSRCRLPPYLLHEIETLAGILCNLVDAEDLANPARELWKELKSITIFRIYDRKSFAQRKPATRDLLDITPEFMAIILGHMEAEVRSRYLEPEIMALYASYCLGNQSGVDPDQVDALPFSDLVVIWVKSCVIFSNEVMERIKLVKHFVKVAQECHLHQNIATAISIIRALQELNIQALKITWKGVGEKTMKALRKLGSKCNDNPKSPSVNSHPHSIWPLILNCDLDMIVQLKALKEAPRAPSINTCRDITTRLCSRETLSAHRVIAKPFSRELSMCSQLILSSMDEACQQKHRLRDGTHLLKLQKDEANEFERTRADIIF